MYPHPPTIPTPAPPGTFLVELLIFHEHWAYYINSSNPDLGVLIHAVGNITTGFEFTIQRSYGPSTAENPPTQRTPLQWVDGKLFDEKAMLDDSNNGGCKPVCGFEVNAHKVRTPGRNEGLDNYGDKDWVIEVAEEFVKGGIFSHNVLDYLQTVRLVELAEL